MSYEPTVWKDGDLVTSAKLNKLEQGVANGEASIFVVNAAYTGNDDEVTLDKTAGEIIEAFQRGLVFMNAANGDYMFLSLLMTIIHEPSGEYYFYFNMQPQDLVASTLNDYPAAGGGR